MDKTFVKELIDSGIHFGHRSGRWNPKMKPYIFCTRSSIHIIDIKETIKGLLRSKRLLTHVVATGKDVLFVGTKRQARTPIEEQAGRCDMHYVSERWLGGILTNFRTIRSRLGRLEELEEMDAGGQLASQSKKMQSTLRREMRKIKRNLDGIRRMDRLPGVLVIIDAKRESIAVKEAVKLGIPTISLIDTDSNPDVIDLVIPGNDDAMKAIDLVMRQLTDAIMEGKSGRAKEDAEATQPQRRSARVTTARAAEELSAGSTESGSKEITESENAVPEVVATPVAAEEPTKPE